MRGHSRPKDGVLSHAYDPRIHDAGQIQNSCDYDRLRCLMDRRVKPGDDRPRGWYAVIHIDGRAFARRRAGTRGRMTLRAKS